MSLEQNRKMAKLWTGRASCRCSKAPRCQSARCFGITHIMAIKAAPGAAIRRGDWKLIEWFEDNRAELYNLKDDLGEQTDLAAKEPQLVQKLRDELHAWQKQVGAKLPTPNLNYDPTKTSGRAAVRKK